MTCENNGPAGRVTALVAGSELYNTEVRVKRAPAKLWKSLTERCTGRIDSVVELLAGRISHGAAPESATSSVRRVRKGTKLTSADLNALGVPRTTFQNWFALGALERTVTRGLHRATSETRRFIERSLARRSGS